MNKIEIAKTALGIAATLGSGTITTAIVRNNVTTKTPLETVTVAVGAFALGGAVAEVAKNSIDRTVDEVVTAFKTLKKAPTA